MAQNNEKVWRGLIRLFVMGLVLLLPLMVLGGSSASSVGASPSLPGEAGKVDSDTLAERYDVLVLRVYFRDVAERDALAYELAPEEIPTRGGFLTVVRDRELYYELKARGIRVEVDEVKSRFLSEPESLPDTFYGGYKTVEEVYAFLDQKVAQYPTLVQKVDIGDSWCKTHPGSCTQPSPWNGYDLYVMRISNQAIPGPKPVFWADGNIHAREIATPEVVMRMISWLLDNYNTNADARWLVDYHDIWLMPEVNPDGHHIVEAGGGGSSPYMYRKNGNRTLGGACSWPPDAFNHFGVDNNRNFPFKWGCCGGSSTAPCEQTYRGTAAGGEEETAAIVNKIRTLIPDQRGPGDTDAAPITTTGVYQNIHTVVPVNLYPWGWTSNLMPNFNETDNIARRISSPGQGGNNYPYGCIVCELYVVDGGSIDWAYGELGVAAISTELGGGDFLPAFSCIDNPGCGSSQGIWHENRGMLTYLAKIARTPYLLSHGPDANTVATSPMTATQGSPVQLTSTIKFNWTASDGQPNRFSQNVGAAEYYIDTPPWAGGSAVAMAPTDGTFNSAQEGAQATIDTTSLSLGRHVVFVRGRGQADFSGHQTWGPMSAAFLDVVPGVGPTPTRTATPACIANYVIATATATIVPGTFDIGNHTDEGTTAISLPFGFRLYDQTFNNVTVSSNGTAEFASAVGNHENTCLPSFKMPTYTIFAYWDDQRTDAAGKGIFTSVTGIAPNRIFNIEWRTTYFSGGGEATFELRLYETSANAQFDIIYGLVGQGNGNSTSGVERDNVFFTQYFCNGTGGTPATGRLVTYTLGACATPTRTNTAVAATNTPTRTNTATNTPTRTNTSVNTPTRTSTATNTPTRTNTATNTPVPPTNTATRTNTATNTATRTNTPLPTQTPGGNTATPVPTNTRTNTATNTSVPATNTRTNTPAPTNTSGPGVTSSPTDTSLPQVTATDTVVASTATATTCPLLFTDVPTDHTFYDSIRCLACRGIINGYASGCEEGNPCFRPGNNVTRGQLAKIVSNSAGFFEPVGAQQFEDVPVGSTFFDFVWRLTNRGHVSGYLCGGPGEPCLPPGNLPYFRPNANITRGQITKIVANAAGFLEPVGAQQFEDVAPGSTFYDFVWRLTNRSIMSGYTCGGLIEPCVPPDNLPYFRPGANATRGQASKIVANTFFPNCVTPAR